MRRYLPLILVGVVLVTPFILRLAIGTPPPPGGGPGAVTLTIITPHNEGIRREFGDAFAAWHREKYGQPVAMDYRSYGGGASDIVRFFQASEAYFKTHGTYKIDLVWGGGDFLFDNQLKKPGYLAPVKLDDDLMAAVYPRPDLGGVGLYDRGPKDAPAGYVPHWYGTALASFGIVYNKDVVVRYLGMPAPVTWKDMKDPRLAGWVALADPTRSASAKMAFMIIVERSMQDAADQGRSEDDGWAEGMGLVRQIAANARLFTDSAPLVPAMVSTGDAGAGMAIDFYGRSQADSVGEQRMAYVEPPSATAINPDPIAMVKGAEHPEVAKHFIEFVLSEQGQRLWNTRHGLPGGPRQTALRRLPIRPSIYENPDVMTDQVNPYTASGGFNKSDAREKTFNILGELIEMSCMTPQRELRETRAAILRSPRAAELDARLGRFPFDQKEALRRAGVWKDAKPAAKLELQRQWTAEFREEYRKLREEAK